MALTEDLAVYFVDFGVQCVSGAVTFTAILDAPDDVLGLGQVGAVSQAPTIVYVTADVALAYGDAITVAGLAYTVQEVLAISDGNLTRARIGRT